jgi:hypothetical protein
LLPAIDLPLDQQESLVKRDKFCKADSVLPGCPEDCTKASWPANAGGSEVRNSGESLQMLTPHVRTELPL